MELKIEGVREHGALNDEYVQIEALRNCNLGRFGLKKRSYGDGTTAGNLGWPHRFSAKMIQAVDVIIVRTCAGKDGEYKTPSGNTIHQFYLGLDSALWSTTGPTPILVESDD